VGRRHIAIWFGVLDSVQAKPQESGLVFVGGGTMQNPEIIHIASGDLRLTANQTCWPAQQKVEEVVIAAVRKLGYFIRRGHPFDPVQGHGFIHSQRHGIEIFQQIPPEAPLIVVEAVWQYSHHVLPGLMTHRGPILTIANWSVEWTQNLRQPVKP